MLDFGDILYINASVQCLDMLDTLPHSALRFVTGCKMLTRHGTLYIKANWPSLSILGLVKRKDLTREFIDSNLGR